jgi:hypothetical protein
MGNNNAEVIIKTRSPFERRRVKDRRSFFKLQTLSPDDRRRVKDRRSFFTLQTRSPVDRRRVKDRLSFFKLQTRSPVDRRRVKDRLSFFKQKYLDHNPERRANMIGRRMLGDRRVMFSRYYEYFLERSALIFKRKPLGR